MSVTAKTANQKHTSTKAPTPITLDAVGTRLESLLDGLNERYTRLVELGRAHREALRLADAAALKELTKVEGTILGEIALLDRDRQTLVREACGTIVVPGKTLALTDIAGHVGEPRRGALVRKAEDLRGVMRLWLELSAAIKQAATTLAAHMDGLVRQVGKQLSHAGTYSRRGYIEASGAVVSSLDLKS